MDAADFLHPSHMMSGVRLHPKEIHQEWLLGFDPKRVVVSLFTWMVDEAMPRFALSWAVRLAVDWARTGLVNSKSASMKRVMMRGLQEKTNDKPFLGLFFRNCGKSGHWRSFQHGQTGPATGGDVADPFGNAQQLSCCRGISPTHNAGCGLFRGASHGFTHRRRSSTECLPLKDAHGAIPHDGLGCGQHSANV